LVAFAANGGVEPNLTNAALRLNVCIFFHGPQFLDQALASSPNSI
jgi:hypothetical protein